MKPEDDFLRRPVVENAVSRRDLIQSSFYLSLVGLISMAVSFLSNLVLVRFVSPEQFGVFGLAIALNLFIYLPAGFSFDRVIVQCRENIPKLFESALTLSVLLALGTFLFSIAIIYFVLKPIYKPDVIKILPIISFWQALALVGNVYGAVNEREMNFKKYALIKFVSAVVPPLLAVFLAVRGMGLYSLLVRDFFFTLVTCFGFFIIAPFRPRLGWSGDGVKYTWNYGRKMLIAQSAEALFSRLDQWLIGTLWGTQQLGYYSQAHRLTFTMGQLAEPVVHRMSWTLYPRFVNDSTQFRLAFENINFLVARGMMVVSLTALFFSKDIVVFLYGPNWFPSVPYFVLLLGLTSVLPLFENLKVALYSDNKVNAITQLRVIQMGLLLSTVVLMRRLNIGGEAVATTISLLWLFGVAYLARLAWIRWGVNISSVFLWPLIFLCIGFLTHYATSERGRTVSAALLLSIILLWIIVEWRLVLAHYEKIRSTGRI